MEFYDIVIPDLHNNSMHILYFLEYFPWVLLISECARMWIQIKGGVGLINVTTLLWLCVH